MRRNVGFVLVAIVACLFGSTGGASAQCAVPNQISNGQVADASQIMANFNAVLNCLGKLPTTPGTTGQLLTSGGSSNPQTWTSTGTSGHALPFLDGSNAWSGTQTFGPVVGSVSTQAGTAYTLAATDCGTTILFSGSTSVTLTTLNNLPAGCAIAIEQAGTGQIVIAAGAGATQHSAHGYTRTYGQYAILGLFVDSNVGGSAANFIITGDGS